MADIEHYNYEMVDLKTKYLWLQNVPGRAAVDPARAVLEAAAQTYEGSDQRIKLTMLGLGLSWNGTAATSAATALRQAAQRSGAANVASSKGNASVDDYGVSFEEMRRKVHWEDPEVAWQPGPVPSTGVDPFAVQADQFAVVQQNRTLDAEANQALHAHEQRTREAVAAFPTLDLTTTVPSSTAAGGPATAPAGAAGAPAGSAGAPAGGGVPSGGATAPSQPQGTPAGVAVVPQSPSSSEAPGRSTSTQVPTSSIPASPVSPVPVTPAAQSRPTSFVPGSVANPLSPTTPSSSATPWPVSPWTGTGAGLTPVVPGSASTGRSVPGRFPTPATTDLGPGVIGGRSPSVGAEGESFARKLPTGPEAEGGAAARTSGPAGSNANSGRGGYGMPFMGAGAGGAGGTQRKTKYWVPTSEFFDVELPPHVDGVIAPEEEQ